MSDIVKTEPLIVWHYTVGAAIPGILADEELQLGWLGGRYRVLWFSANPVWEPSSRKNDGENKEQTALHYGGLYRVSVASTGLTRWNEWKHTLKTNPQSLVKFEKYGNPSEWWCSFTPVPSSRWKSIERLIGDKWQGV